ncbi:unnamed protein product [Laminaria digitata]
MWRSDCRARRGGHLQPNQLRLTLQAVPSFSLPRTPSPRRRRGGRSKGPSPPETPGSPDRPCTPTSPTTPPSLRRRRRRAGGRRSFARRLRSRASSLSVCRVSSTACRSPEALFSSPPSSPDRLRTEMDSMATSCCSAPMVVPVTKKEEGSSQAAEFLGPVVVPVTKKAEGSSQEAERVVVPVLTQRRRKTSPARQR